MSNAHDKRSPQGNREKVASRFSGVGFVLACAAPLSRLARAKRSLQIGVLSDTLRSLYLRSHKHPIIRLSVFELIFSHLKDHFGKTCSHVMNISALKFSSMKKKKQARVVKVFSRIINIITVWGFSMIIFIFIRDVEQLLFPVVIGRF